MKCLWWHRTLENYNCAPLMTLQLRAELGCLMAFKRGQDVNSESFLTSIWENVLAENPLMQLCAKSPFDRTRRCSRALWKPSPPENKPLKKNLRETEEEEEPESGLFITLGLCLCCRERRGEPQRAPTGPHQASTLLHRSWIRCRCSHHQHAFSRQEETQSITPPTSAWPCDSSTKTLNFSKTNSLAPEAERAAERSSKSMVFKYEC